MINSSPLQEFKDGIASMNQLKKVQTGGGMAYMGRGGVS